MPQVSLITIAKNDEQIEGLRQALSRQTWQDFELISSTGSTSPEAWTSALRRASGNILVFLDVDARPVDERWLGELVSELTNEKTIVKGLEITASPLDPSSLAGFRQAFVDHPFDESYPWAEDTELFCRLKASGYRFTQLACAPVIHPSKPGSKTVLRRAFRYGIYYQRLRRHYRDPVELNGFVQTFKLLVASLLNILGVLVGSWVYRQKSADGAFAAPAESYGANDIASQGGNQI